MDVIAIFGPTSAGKTRLAIAVAEKLGDNGEEPVAISCDAIQVYRGVETISGAASAEEQAALEHRLVGFVDPGEEFSAGRFAELARTEIDEMLRQGRRPIVVGGTGLYMRAALADLDLRPPVSPELRGVVEAEIAERGSAAVHGELPSDVGDKIDPNDRKRIARATELLRAGLDPAERSTELWTRSLRHPTLTVAVLIDRDELDARIEARVDAMVDAGAVDDAQRLDSAGVSRTARAALGFDHFLAGDIDAVKAAHRRYARRQLTWLRKMGADLEVDVTEGQFGEAAAEIVSRA